MRRYRSEVESSRLWNPVVTPHIDQHMTRVRPSNPLRYKHIAANAGRARLAVAAALTLFAGQAQAQSAVTWAITQGFTLNNGWSTIPNCPINTGTWIGLDRVTEYNCEISDAFSTTAIATATPEGTLRASASQSLNSANLGAYDRYVTTSRADWRTGSITLSPSVAWIDFVFRYSGTQGFNATLPVFPIVDDWAHTHLAISAIGLPAVYSGWSGAVVTNGQIQNTSNVLHGNATFNGIFAPSARRVDVDGMVRFCGVPVFDGMLEDVHFSLFSQGCHCKHLSSNATQCLRSYVLRFWSDGTVRLSARIRPRWA